MTQHICNFIAQLLKNTKRRQESPVRSLHVKWKFQFQIITCIEMDAEIPPVKP